MSVIDIYQTAGSNQYLASCKQLIEPLHQPVFDLLLSKLVKVNNLDRAQRAKQAEAPPDWRTEMRLELGSIAKILYPAGSSAKPSRDRRAWVANAQKSVQAILDSGWLVEVWTEDDDTYFKVRQDVTKFISTFGVPSPIHVPVELYKYKRLGSHALATHAFIANRRLLVDQKMNPEMWSPDRIMDIDWFCKIFMLPTPREWKRKQGRSWVEGPSQWEQVCLQRNIGYYGIYSARVIQNQVVIHRI